MIYRCLPWLVTLQIVSLHLMAQPQSLFVIAGQSNAVGRGTRDSSVIGTPGTAFEYRSTPDALVPLADPVGEDELHFQVAKAGSIGPAFAEAYYLRTGRQVILLSAARGGASCHESAEIPGSGTWDTEGQLPLFEGAITKMQRATRKTGRPVSGIVWLQGERDANAINDGQLSAAAYQLALTNLIARFRSRLGSEVRFYIVQTGHYTGHSTRGFDQVRAAQAEVARRLPNVHVVYRETDQFAARGWMRDAIHYNQTGLNHIGQSIAREIADLN